MCCNPLGQRFLQEGGGIGDARDSQNGVVSEARLIAAVSAQTFLCLQLPADIQKNTFPSDKRPALYQQCSNYGLFKLHSTFFLLFLKKKAM